MNYIPIALIILNLIILGGLIYSFIINEKLHKTNEIIVNKIYREAIRMARSIDRVDSKAVCNDCGAILGKVVRNPDGIYTCVPCAPKHRLVNVVT